MNQLENFLILIAVGIIVSTCLYLYFNNFANPLTETERESNTQSKNILIYILYVLIGIELLLMSIYTYNIYKNKDQWETFGMFDIDESWGKNPEFQPSANLTESFSPMGSPGYVKLIDRGCD